MKILIAYDSSETADAMLADLMRAGLPPEADAVVMAVAEWLPPVLPLVPPGAMVVAVDPLMQVLEAKRDIAQAACHQIRSCFPMWHLNTETATGSPATALLKKADEWQPDLIVTGSHNHTALGRFFLGSVSQKLVTAAPCSVRIARKHKVTSPLRLLIGFDGSPDAEAAVSAVAARTWPTDTKARLYVAFDRVMGDVADYLEATHHASWKWLFDTLEAAGDKLRAASLMVSSEIKTGNPKQLLPAEAESWDADCIFVGARGLSPWERFRLGSVSAAIAARAHCSVEVVRPI